MANKYEVTWTIKKVIEIPCDEDVFDSDNIEEFAAQLVDEGHGWRHFIDSSDVRCIYSHEEARRHE